MRWQGVEGGEATKGVEGEEGGEPPPSSPRLRPSDVDGRGASSSSSSSSSSAALLLLLLLPLSARISSPPTSPYRIHGLTDTPYRFYNSIYVNTHLSND